MIEVFNTINPDFMRDTFEQKSTTYNLKCENVLRIAETKTKKYGMWTAKFNGKC